MIEQTLHPIAFCANQYRKAVLRLERTERLDLTSALTETEREDYLHELRQNIAQCAQELPS